MKRGLVLEGGAMRGLFTAGIIDVLMQNNITFDGMIGVSAGAAFGCNFKSGQVGRAKRYNINFCRDKRYCSMRSLLTTGNMYGAEFCYHELPEKLDLFDKEAFENNPMEFFLVCTDVISGNAIYHKMDKVTYDELEWMRASASMPLVSKIVEVDGMKMLDGGVTDSVPIRYFQSIGYNRNVVVLTQHRAYRKKKNSILPIIRVVLRKYPKLVSAMERRHEVYNKTLDYIFEQEKAGNVFVLAPDKALPIKRTEHKKEVLEEVYNIGKEKITEKLGDLKYFLNM